jgi:AcrR family transcriptional regulator
MVPAAMAATRPTRKAARAAPSSKVLATKGQTPAPRAASRRLLGKDAWTDEAVRTLATGGVAAISVERLAEALGVTKGSFYWHFENREALVRAVLERWEDEGTERVIEALEAIADPRERLVQLLALSLDQLDHLRAEAAFQAAASAGDPLIAPVVARVVRRRLAYTESIFRALGLPRGEAATRARVAFGAYLGTVLLAAQGLLEGGDRSLAAQRRVLEALLVR